MASRKQQKESLRAQRLEREAEERKREQRRRLVQYGSGAAFLAICAIVVLVIVSQSGGGSGGDTTLEGQAAVSQQLRGLQQNRTVLGDPKAKVTIIEYGDLQCPVCQAFSVQVTPALLKNEVRKGTAKYDFRQWTIIGPQSQDAAKAALAAGEQGRYWNFISLFYENQGTENSGYVTDAFLESIAKGAGVPDIAKWNQDRQSSKWDAVITRTDREATSLGFTGTPSIMVEGPKGKKPFLSSVPPSAAQVESAVQAVQ